MKPNSYYRGKFMIGVYSLLEEGETLLALCDNIQEFADLMNITKNNAAVILHKLFINISKNIIYNKKVRKVEFIEVED